MKKRNKIIILSLPIILIVIAFLFIKIIPYIPFSGEDEIDKKARMTRTLLLKSNFINNNVEIAHFLENHGCDGADQQIYMDFGGWTINHFKKANRILDIIKQDKLNSICECIAFETVQCGLGYNFIDKSSKIKLQHIDIIRVKIITKLKETSKLINK
jgi:hypothetical protein